MSTDVKTGPIPTVNDPSMIARLLCEMLGTLWLVFGGAGSAVFAASQIQEGNINMGLGYLGVALAFGLTVFTGAYSFGTFSGGHFNPAVTIGLAVGRRFRWRDVPGYIVAQVIGGLLAGGLIYIIASGKDGFEATGSMAANGYGAHSPNGYGLAAVLIAEIALTAFFLWIILGVTDKRATPGAAGAVIGLALTLIHLISIPISNTSVNPARSMGVAFFHGDGAPGQLWVFWLAPIIGAIIAGVTYKFITDARD
ncbi:aquaporin Z [Corynebacterium xerosis]